MLPLDCKKAGHIVDDVLNTPLCNFRGETDGELGCVGDTCGDGERAAYRVSLGGICTIILKRERALNGSSGCTGSV